MEAVALQIDDLRRQVAGGPPTPPPERRAAAVLWVDDRPENNALLIDQLMTDGVQVDVARTTEEGLALASRRGYGAVITDMGRWEDGRYHTVAGVDFARRETVRIRDRYDASVPTVVGAVGLEEPVFAADARFLRQQTDQPIKWALPGPMTMIDTLADRHYGSREKLAWEFARILNEEARELAAVGVDVVQFDEPAFNVFFDDVRDWGVATLERAAEGLTCETAVHICYGYGIKANNDWKATLGQEWRQYETSFPLLRESTIDTIALERHHSRVPAELIGLVRGKKVMVGAIDVASDEIETPEEVAATLRETLEFVDADKLIASTNCGMAPLARSVARDKTAALVAGARILREELGGE